MRGKSSLRLHHRRLTSVDDNLLMLGIFFKLQNRGWCGRWSLVTFEGKVECLWKPEFISTFYIHFSVDKSLYKFIKKKKKGSSWRLHFKIYKTGT